MTMWTLTCTTVADPVWIAFDSAHHPRAIILIIAAARRQILYYHTQWLRSTFLQTNFQLELELAIEVDPLAWRPAAQNLN
jgi:hypothetical protein